MIPIKELKYNQLNSSFSSDNLKFKTTDELEPLEGIIGQERAVKAFDFGLNVKTKGYNIYMSGPSGVGKTTYAKARTEEISKNEKTPYDWCYVYNFETPHSPIALRFDAGVGKQFRDDMSELIEIFNTEIQKAFNSSDYEKQKANVYKSFEDKREEIIKDMSDMAGEYDFAVKNTNSGIYFMPVISGETLNEEQYDALSEDIKKKITEDSVIVQQSAASLMHDMRETEREGKKAVDDLDYKVCMFAIGHYVNAVQQKYKDHSKVMKYLEAVQEDVLENIEQFVDDEADDDVSLSSLLPMISKKSNEDITLKYKVNLVVDNSKTIGAPVITDYNPTFYNLIGEVEYDNEYGNLTTDFMKIKCGSFHKANGGYLIIQSQDLLFNPQSWEAMKRIIRTKEITIESIREHLGGVAIPTLKPEPIPIDIKIILIGSGYYYEILHEYDDDFDELFKIRADFDFEMKRNDKNIDMFTKFIGNYVRKENLKPIDAKAVIKVLEYSSRTVENQDKLSTRFSVIGDILSEASTWAEFDNNDVVSADYINKAIIEKENRLRMYEEKLDELFDENIILIDTKGSKIGQINGLAVYDMGSYSFGKPTRITATTYMGKAGIVNIEKEADMSGSTHNKGIQIITGYLGQTYAQDFPLSMSCRVAFEQNYSDIDGDSASSAELYCILSSLAEIPIKQNIAVTGSVNQNGDIQAIGGVTYKVEAFYDLCKKRGLTGSQGVIIPATNVKDLVLKEDVVESVKNNDFHIYPINTVGEGMEILTGIEFGNKTKENEYEENTVNGKAMKKLKDYYEKSIKIK